MIRHAIPLVVLVAAACSQRAQWRAVETSPLSASPGTSATPSPRPTPVKAVPADAVPTRARGTAIALSSVAAVPSLEPAVDATAVAHLKGMLFPVGGVDSMRLDDSFDATRDGGSRKHNAIDIMAPLGTPVLAVSDGRILRLMKSSKGGLTLYATDLEDQFVYYYAHLDRYNPRIYSGKPLMRGDTLGFVGTTGNAPANLPHLHFQVMRMPANGNFVNGTPINPYPLLNATPSAEK